MEPYRIVSIDGGGVRGIFAAALLEKIHHEAPEALARADLLAGTSTGGLIVLSLAYGMSPEEIVRLFEENGKRIFSGTFLGSIKDLNGFVGPEYRFNFLKGLLEERFGDTRLGDLERHVVIPAFSLDNLGPDGKPTGGPRSWHPRFLHNLPHDETYHGERLVDVALRTSAAPMYFPTYQGHIDGGVVANNPSLAAVTTVRRAAPDRSLASFRLLSIGTGLVPAFIERDRNWGVRQWIKPLLRLMVEGSMGAVHEHCEALLGAGYHRLDPMPSVAVKLDDSKRMDALVECARGHELNGTVDWLAEHF